MVFTWFRQWRRRRILRTRALDDELWQRALRGVRSVARLDASETARLCELVLLFLHEKHIEGVRGCEVDDAMRYSIAVQACLLILNLGLDAYAGWTSIWVYPGAFVDRDRDRDPDGEPMVGVTLPGGGVALSWDDVVAGGRRNDGFNPVFHELAHKLDMLDGAANGVPPLPNGITPAEWQQVFSSAFEDFRERAEDGESALDDYAAESPAEFFAVLTEAFFEIPERLEGELPAVYDLLRRYYRQDPLR